MKKAFLALALVLAFAASARATTITYVGILTGPKESPVNASPGLGFAVVTTDNVASTMQIDVQFSGLLGNTTASHIHCCSALPFTGTAGVATTTPTFAGFPLGVKSGTYSVLLDMTLASSYNPSYVTANGGTTASAMTALFTGMEAGKSYFNIHSTSFPGGEIRSFLEVVPEPATMTLVGLGLGLVARRRLRRKTV